MSCKETEAVCILFQKHLSKVTMSKTYFTLISYRSRNTECLKSFTDCCCSFCCCLTAFFNCNCSTYYVSPACVLKTDWLNALNLIVYIKSGILCNLLCFLD